MVFADSKQDQSKLPAGAKEVRSKAGNTIPMVFVTTADGAKGIEGISYDTLKKGTRDANRDLRKLLKENPAMLESEEATSTEEEIKTKPSLLAQSQEWTNATGTAITAAIQKVEGDTVHFLMPNGNVVPYSMAKLSPESQDKIKGLLNL